MINYSTTDRTELALIGYAICALWSSVDDETPLDSTHDIDGIAPATLAKMREDVAAFLAAAGETTQDAGQVGHDFWLTRNGHGTGFWDRGLGDEGDRLAELAKGYGECDLYVGDDGMIHSD